MTRFGLCALLSAIAAWTSLHAQEAIPDQPPSALPWLKIDELSATRDRPLFAPDRRKFMLAPTSAVATVDPGSPTPRFALMGIIVEPMTTIILLRDLARSDAVIVHSGERFGRWRLVADTDHSVRLWDGDERLHLKMFAGP